MELEQIGLTVGPLKLASIGIAGKLTVPMKDRLQSWVQKKNKGCHAMCPVSTPPPSPLGFGPDGEPLNENE